VDADQGDLREVRVPFDDLVRDPGDGLRDRVSVEDGRA
jgi:hypothetical protein